MLFYREKKIDTGRYREVDIIPRTLAAEQTAKRGTRSKKVRISRPQQQSLNEKNSKRYLLQLANGNFGKGDLHVTCTYSDEYLPETVKEAEKEITNYLRRISYRRKKKGLDPLKYILVTEYKLTDAGWTKRIHHHIIMNAGLDRDEVEGIWSKHGHQMGYVNADRIQVNQNGLEALTRYLTKDPQGRKRWSSSRNLVRPCQRTNDYKYRTSKIESLAEQSDQAWEYFAKKYPKYDLVAIDQVYYEDTGWHVYLRLWQKTRPRGGLSNGK
ncbi:rolling circle replication-associated protein [Lapidilactobacillus luobeiensis]|uniref:rolling circle replication-associated protein n=1 Tax=Lapidilactobacillus luobeiensis TaxID=2950371 RepID=UPI0021C284F4|nr:hypothetical protein [Lapidilactobacillus luobeiensis]